jgi:ribosomal protein S18 acetylase RimI-like enzyme
MSDDADALAAVLDFKRAQLLKAAEHVEPVTEVEGGLAVFSPALSRVWELNLLLAPAGASAAAIERLMEASERLQGAAGLRHRKLRLGGPGPADVLERLAGAAGWDLDRELVMVRRRAPDGRPAPRVAIREIGADELASAEDRFLRSEPYGRDPAVRRELIAQHERWARAVTVARQIGIVEDGQVVGWCRLYDDRGLTEIDSVGVLPERRGRGLGRALLEGVLAAVPPDRMLFLLADTADWPKDLYGRLGFDAVGERLGATSPGGADDSRPPA